MRPTPPAEPQDCIDAASTWSLRLADGRLSPEERSVFEAWRADPENARALDEVTRTWQALDAASVSPDLIGMRQDALEAFRRGQASRWKSRASRWRTAVAAAACVAAVAVAAVLWMQLMPQHYATGLGERRIVALPDGSKISLDAQSSVKVRYSDDRRQLWLTQGRARFRVARDSLRPFSVSAADKVVVATGTEFSVEMLERQVHVILYHGSVDVLAEQRGSKPQPVQMLPPPGAPSSAGSVASLTPGTELIAPVAATVGRIEAIDPVGSAAWEGGQLVFRDEPLAAAVERMNRYADVPLAIGDAAAARMLISGVYAAGDTSAFVEGVTGVFPIRVREVDGRQELFSRP